MDKIATGVFASAQPGTPPEVIQLQIDKLVEEANKVRATEVANAKAQAELDKEKKKVRRLTVKDLFIARMRRAGKGDWIDTRFLELKLTGNRNQDIWKIIMQELAFPGKRVELELEEQYQRQEKFTKREETREKKATIQEQAKILTFEEAVKSLPLKSNSIKEELDWIRAHSAMLRYHQQRDKNKEIVITVQDILEADHGPAPCRSAVISLQYWVNHPNKFHEMMMGEHKKEKDDAGSGKATQQRDLGLDEVEKLLEDFNSEAH